MIVTRKSLPRRTILRSIGATLALPWLDSMVPAFSALEKTSAVPGRRLGIFYAPNGMAMPYWSPKQEGALSELPPILRPLAAHRDQVLMLGGLNQELARIFKKGGGGPHAHSTGVFLTCVPVETTANGLTAAKTVDQLVATEFGKETQIASLELGLEPASLLGTCEGTSCSVTNSISWATPTTPLVPDNDPRSVFERLFGLSGSTDTAARRARIQRDRSILDTMTGQLARLTIRVGPRDKAKLDEYLTSVRDVERRIQKAEEQSARELPVLDQPTGIPSDFSEHALLMMDLLALAFQTDLTRVGTFMFGGEISGRAYPEIGVPDSHHPLSHHSNDPARIERLSKVNEYHVRQFAYLVDKLSKLTEGDGTMLDHSLFLYGCGISDSNIHAYNDLPIALIGGKAIGVKGGRYVRYPDKTPLANLYVTLLRNLG